MWARDKDPCKGLPRSGCSSSSGDVCVATGVHPMNRTELSGRFYMLTPLSVDAGELSALLPGTWGKQASGYRLPGRVRQGEKDLS